MALTPVEITSLVFGTVDSAEIVDCAGETIKCPIHLSADGKTATLDECNLKKCWIALASWSTEGRQRRKRVCTLAPNIEEMYADDLARARLALTHGFDFDQLPLDLGQSFTLTERVIQRYDIFWPSDGLSTVIDATFDDGWNPADDPNKDVEQRRKTIHLILWSIAAYNPELNAIVLGTLDPKYVNLAHKTTQDICRFLHFKPISTAGLGASSSSTGAIKSDNRANRLARALVGLGMMGKSIAIGNDKEAAAQVNKWMRARMKSLFRELRESEDLLKDVRDAPQQVIYFKGFVACQPRMVESLVHYVLEIVRQSNVLAAPIDVALMRQVKMLFSWSGLVGVKKMHDFVHENKSAVWLIPEIAEEREKFKQAYKEYVRLNGSKKAQYGRLLRLPLVETLTHSIYPNLFMAAVLATRKQKPTFVDYNHHFRNTIAHDQVNSALDIKLPPPEEEAEKRLTNLRVVVTSLMKGFSPSEYKQVIEYLTSITPPLVGDPNEKSSAPAEPVAEILAP